MAPEVTAKSWVIYDKLRGAVIDGKKITKKTEVASLTKIMTFCVCNEVLKRHSLEPRKYAIAHIPGKSLCARFKVGVRCARDKRRASVRRPIDASRSLLCIDAALRK
jgi:hypothetical protein